MKYISKCSFLILFVLTLLTLCIPALLHASVIKDEDIGWDSGAENLDMQMPVDEFEIMEKDIPRYIWLTGKYLEAGKFQKVVTICEKIFKIDENHIEAHANLAAAYKGLGDDEKFNYETELTRKLAPKSAALYVPLAKVFLSFKDYANAENTYNEGLKTALDKAELQMGLADLYINWGKLNEAGKQYNKALLNKELKQKYFLRANIALCRIGLQQKEYDQVIKRAGMIIDLYPPIPQGYLFSGSALLGKGKTEQAIKVYEKLMKVNPDSPVSYNELALIYIDKFIDYEKAVNYARESVKKFPEDAKSFDVLGWVYYNNKMYFDAVNQFKAAARLAQGNPVYFYHLGLAQQESGEKLKARESYEKALEMIKPTDSKEFASELIKRIDSCR